jgi:hypothetical protein
MECFVCLGLGHPSASEDGHVDSLTAPTSRPASAYPRDILPQTGTPTKYFGHLSNVMLYSHGDRAVPGLVSIATKRGELGILTPRQPYLALESRVDVGNRRSWHVGTDRAVMVETTGRNLTFTRAVTAISPRSSNHGQCSVIPRYHRNGGGRAACSMRSWCGSASPKEPFAGSGARPFPGSGRPTPLG